MEAINIADAGFTYWLRTHFQIPLRPQGNMPWREMSCALAEYAVENNLSGWDAADQLANKWHQSREEAQNA